MKVLVACEESQTVCKAFREKGHEAYSCDIQQCSGDHPEWHILGDALPIINGDCSFYTQSGDKININGKWDILIAHPPCTDLAVSGARWFPEKQKDFRQQKSVVLFMQFALANCDRIAIENPIGIMSTCYRKPDQIIQPYEYGHPVRKSTCLWLKGLPKLEPTKIVKDIEYDKYGFSIGGALRYATDENGKIISWNDPRTAKIRSKTFQGIADAMAEQWGCENYNVYPNFGQINIFDFAKIEGEN